MQIKLEQRTLHFKRPARTSRGEYTTHDIILVTIASEDGSRRGVGECAPLPDLSCDRDAYKDMAGVTSLIQHALASDDYAEYLRPFPALLFALESAMCDYQQNPLLYGTPWARGEVGIPINGLVWMDDYDNMLEQVKQKLLQGFRCIKLKIGAIDWRDEIRLIERIRSRFSSSKLELRVDANCAFSPAEAMDKLRELASYDIHSIEQPIARGLWDDMARLCQDSPLPIALDEEVIGVNTLDEKRRLLDTIRPQYVVVKPTLHGGISGGMEWISEARKRDIGSWVTSALESNVGLRSVALMAASVYGPHNTFPQGLGTGLLYTDNITMDIEIRRNHLWRNKKEEG